MSTDISFVRNNPFILNDSRFGSSGHLNSHPGRDKDRVTVTHSAAPYRSGYGQVSQSASCSNIQQRAHLTHHFDAAQGPPVPVSVIRRYRLISDSNLLDNHDSTSDSLSGQLQKQTQMPHIHSQSQSIHSVATYDTAQSLTVSRNSQKFEIEPEPEPPRLHHRQIIQAAQTTDTLQFQRPEIDRRRLEHSQSHSAIYQYQQQQQLSSDQYVEPLRLDLNENREDWTGRQVAAVGGGGWMPEEKRGSFGVNDMEYGPGIVQKLREKFSKMASSAIETVQISPHAKQKKFPSVDDILSDRSSQSSVENGNLNKRNSVDNNNDNKIHHHGYHHEHVESDDSVGIKLVYEPHQHQLQPQQLQQFVERATSPVRQLQNEEPRSVVEALSIPPISALRAKFEQQSRHSSFASRPSYSQRSHSATAIARSQPDPRQQAMRPRIPNTRPTGALPRPIAPERERELIKTASYPDRRAMFDSEAPRPVRVMDLISPPADPAPPRYSSQDREWTEQPAVSSTAPSEPVPDFEASLASPGASSTSTDSSPPPEEPTVLAVNSSQERIHEIHQNQQNVDFSRQTDSYHRTQTVQDERSNERQYYNSQKNKMTLTLPIGEPSSPFRSSSTSDIKTGRPGNTPLPGPNKLKISNDGSGISEVQKLLNRFSHMREQKMQDSFQTDAIKSELTEQVQASVQGHHTSHQVQEDREKHLPTAIVPPVPQQQQRQPQSQFQKQEQFVPQHYMQLRKGISSKEDAVKPTPMPKPPTSTQWQPLHPPPAPPTHPQEPSSFKQKNIVSINIGQPLDSTATVRPDEPNTSSKLRQAPPPPPPLPPKGGNEQQNLQRKSLTSRWLESKDTSSSSSSIETDDGTLDKKTFGLEKEAALTASCAAYAKPYGDDEVIEEQARRAVETMSVVKEESEEDAEEEPVQLISERKIGEMWRIDDNKHVSRSDFLKTQSSTSFDSSESEEDDQMPHAHLAAYNIHRLGLYDPPPASDGNPVRHSLLHLVAEEDIPELLQAMAEEHHFVFDDCDDNMATTSGIIHAPAKRLERRKQRNVDRICFVEKDPEVFAYVDETTAYEEGHWHEGVPISYDEYKDIVEAAQLEQAQQHMEVAKWRQAMELRYNMATDADPVPENKDLGVTNTFSYDSSTQSATAPSTTSPSTASCGTPLQFRQTDMGTSAI